MTGILNIRTQTAKIPVKFFSESSKVSFFVGNPVVSFIIHPSIS